MKEKIEMKVKLLWIILFVVTAMLLIAAGVLICFKTINNSNTTDMPIVNTSAENNKTQYYEPSEQEKLRTEELETILKADLPVMDG